MANSRGESGVNDFRIYLFNAFVLLRQSASRCKIRRILTLSEKVEKNSIAFTDSDSAFLRKLFWRKYV